MSILSEELPEILAGHMFGTVEKRFNHGPK
jgi:hypothetical protein